MTENAWMFSPNPLGGGAPTPSRTIADLDAEIERRRQSAKRDRLSTDSNGVQQPPFISPSIASSGRPFNAIEYPIASPNAPIASSDTYRINKIESDLREERIKTISLLQKIAQLEREIEDHRLSITRLTDEKESREDHINGLEDKNEDLEHDLMLARQQLQSLSADNMTWRDQNSTLRSRLQDSLASKSSFDGAPQNPGSVEQESYAAQYSALETHYNSLQYQYYEMQRELHDERLGNENLREVASNLDVDVKSRDYRCMELATRVEELEETVVSMEKDLERLSQHSVPVKLGEKNAPIHSVAPVPVATETSSVGPNFRAPTPRDMSPPRREAEGLRKRSVGTGGESEKEPAADGDGDDFGRKISHQNGAKQGFISDATRKRPQHAGVVRLTLFLMVKSAFLVMLVIFGLVYFEVDPDLFSLLPEYLQLKTICAMLKSLSLDHLRTSFLNVMAMKISKNDLFALVLTSWELLADLQRRVMDFLLKLER